MLYVLISVVVLIISIHLFRKEGTTLHICRLNLISWIFYYNLIAQSFIASLLVINNLESHYMYSSIPDNDPARFWGWLSVMWAMIGIPLGMKIANRINNQKNPSESFNLYLNKKQALTVFDEYLRFPLYFLSGISIAAIIYTFIVIGEVPIFKTFSSASALALSVLRIEASRGFAGNQYFRNIFGTILTPILSFIAFSYWKKSKKVKDLLWFIVMFIAAFFILTFNLAKSSFVRYILGFLFLYILINGRVKLKTVVAVFLVGFSIVILSYILIARVVSFAFLLNFQSGLWSRIFLSQAAATYLSFDIFPQKHDFIGIAGISNFVTLFNIQKTENAARIIMEFINPKGVAAGTAGIANSLFISEAWANFGLPGVILSPLYIGFFLKTLLLFFQKRQKNPVLLGILTSLCYSFSITGGLASFIYPVGIFVLVAIFMIEYFQADMLKIIIKGIRHEYK